MKPISHKISDVLKYCVLISASVVFAVMIISCLLGFSEYAESAVQIIFYLILVCLFYLIIKLNNKLLGKSELKLLLLITGFSLTLRIAFAVFVKTQPDSDFWELYDAAVKLTRGDLSWLYRDYFKLWSYQIPFVLYQALIYKMFGSLVSLKLMNAIFMVGTNILIFKLSRRYTSAQASFTVSMIYAVCPEIIFLTSILTNQHISLFFILLGLYIITSNPKPLSAVWGGLFIGFGNLMRPEAIIIILSIVVVAFICFLKKPSDFKAHLGNTAIILAVYFAFQFACFEIIRISGLAPFGISNNCPEWKFIVGLNPYSLGTYDITNGGILYIVDPALRREETIRIISGYFPSFKGFVSFLWEKVKLFYGGLFDFTWALNYFDLSTNKIAGMSVGNAVYLLSIIDRVLFAAVSVFTGAGVLQIIVKRKTPHRLFLICAAGLSIFFAVFMFIEIQSRYRYFILPAIYIMLAYSVDNLGLKNAYVGKHLKI